MKKKTLLIISSILISFIAFTQISKGDFILGGRFGYNTYSFDFIGASSSNSNANVSPSLGLAVGKNSVVGLRMGFNYSKSKEDGSSNSSTSTSYTAGFFWKKYFSVKSNWGWYSDLNGYAGKGTQKIKSSVTEIKYSSNSLGIAWAPGFYFMPSPAIILNADFGGLRYDYGKSRTENSPDNKNSSFRVNLMNSFSFEIDFILKSKNQ